MWSGAGKGFFDLILPLLLLFVVVVYTYKYIVLQYPMIWWISIIEAKCRVARRTEKMQKPNSFWTYYTIYYITVGNKTQTTLVIMYNLFSTIQCCASERFLFQMRYCNTSCVLLSCMEGVHTWLNVFSCFSTDLGTHVLSTYMYLIWFGYFFCVCVCLAAKKAGNTHQQVP